MKQLLGLRRNTYAGRHRNDSPVLTDAERGEVGDLGRIVGVPLGQRDRVTADLIPDGDLQARDDDPHLRGF